MNSTHSLSSAARWHFRGAGAFWTIVGAASAIHILVHYWEDIIARSIPPLLALLFAASVTVGGCGMCRSSRWARTLMAIAVPLVMLWALDMLLFLTIKSNFSLIFWLTLALLPICIYTVVILVLYRKWR
jgi:hypothetical protein